jgi:hypothetical protein
VKRGYRGHSIVCSANGAIEQYLFVSNLLDGLDQYTLPTMELARHYPYTIKSNFLMQIATTNQGRWVIVGGDDGFARVFDRSDGTLMQNLEHDESMLSVVPMFSTVH